MADMETPVWEVMLQSAQVINQVAQIQRQRQADEERIAMREAELRERSRIADEKHAAVEAKLKAEKAEFDANMELRRIKEDRLADKQDTELALRERTVTLAERKQTWSETHPKINAAKGGAAWRETDAVIAAIDADVARTSRSGDKAFDEKYAYLWDKDDAELGRYEKKLLRPENDALTVIENERLAKNYPAVAEWKEQSAKELAAIRKISQVRDRSFLEKAAIYKESPALSPEAKGILNLRLPSLRKLESSMGDERPAEPKTQQVGADALNRAPTPPATAPGPTVDVMKPLLDEATNLRNRTTATDTDYKGKVSDAAALYMKAYNVNKTAAQQIIVELGGGEVDPANPNQFLKDVAAAVKAQGALRSRPAGASRMTMKK